MKEGILSVVGQTPLIKLSRIFRDSPVNFYAKLEALNPGGSIKDRAAVSIIEDAIEKKLLRPGMTVIESSSGNMGVGLAQVCAYLSLRFICVVDPTATPQNVALIKAYGAIVDLVPNPDPVTGEFLQARIKRVEELLSIHDGSFWPDQYSNYKNAMAHYTTIEEIITSLDGKLDYLFCSTSTCGTVRGCSDYIQKNGLHTKVYAVDAVGSVIFGGAAKKRLIPGHGAAIRPPLYRDGLIEGYIYVTDLDCVVGCRRLVRSEALLAGGSSGGTVTAVEKIRRDLPAGANCALVLPDRGERYLDTVYSDEWVSKHFGDVSHLWEC